jgi:hypothetical protein
MLLNDNIRSEQNAIDFLSIAILLRSRFYPFQGVKSELKTKNRGVFG